MGYKYRVTSTLNGVTLIITLLITDLLSPLGLQLGLGNLVFGLGLFVGSSERLSVTNENVSH